MSDGLIFVLYFFGGFILLVFISYLVVRREINKLVKDFIDWYKNNNKN